MPAARCSISGAGDRRAGHRLMHDRGRPEAEPLATRRTLGASSRRSPRGRRPPGRRPAASRRGEEVAAGSRMRSSVAPSCTARTRCSLRYVVAAPHKKGEISQDDALHSPARPGPRGPGPDDGQGPRLHDEAPDRATPRTSTAAPLSSPASGAPTTSPGSSPTPARPGPSSRNVRGGGHSPGGPRRLRRRHRDRPLGAALVRAGRRRAHGLGGRGPPAGAFTVAAGERLATGFGTRAPSGSAASRSPAASASSCASTG